MNIDNTNKIDLTQIKSEKPNLSTDFNTYLEFKAETTRLGYNPKIPCNIHFYEWSDFEQERIFTDKKEFFDFLKDCKIYTRYWEDNRIKQQAHTNFGVHIICKKGQKDLLIENSLGALKLSFNRIANAVQPQQTSNAGTNNVPAIVHPHPCMYGGYGAYGYDDYYDWD